MSIQKAVDREYRTGGLVRENIMSTDTKIRRRCRYHKREMTKALRNTDTEEPICTICQDKIENSFEAEITSCGHFYHVRCGHENRKFLFKESMRKIREQNDLGLLSPSDLKVHIARTFFEYEVGTTCPNCRSMHPFAHNLARKTTFRNAIYRFPNLIVSFAVEDVLDLVSR